MKNTKKGFTIVELVIVIAIIAILAAVLIPTFSSVISKANNSSAVQACTAAYQDALADAMADGVLETDDTSSSGDWTFKFTATNGAVTGCEVTDSPDKYDDYTFTYANGAWTAAES